MCSYEQTFSDPGLALVSPHPELVPVVFARSEAEAEHYRALLDAAGVPATVGDTSDTPAVTWSINGAIPVLVADGLHDSASEVIAAAQRPARADFDEDYDDDDEDDDFDDDEDEDFDDDDDEDDLDDDFD